MKYFEEERLRNEYTPKVDTNVDWALKLERKMKLPAYIFTYTFGVIGALILGLGMCMTMGVLGSATPIFVGGIMIGLIGIAIVAADYPLFCFYMKKRKERYASAILVTLNEGR